MNFEIPEEIENKTLPCSHGKKLQEERNYWQLQAQSH